MAWYSLNRTMQLARCFAVRSSVEMISSIVAIHNLEPVVHRMTTVRFAGHSHWQNIRHIKDAKDSLKQKVANDIVRKIKLAALENGGTNPKLNSTLAKVLEEGRLKAVSGTTMSNVLKRLEQGGNRGSQLYIEARGIGNCSLIIEAYTEKPKWFRQQVQHVFKQYGGRIGDSGTASPSFHFKGVVYSPVEEGKSLDVAEEAAIECGAEDVQLVEDDSTFQFICDAKQLHAVKSALSNHGFRIREARQEFIPHMFVNLDAGTLDVASEMLDKLEQMEEVENVFNNIDSIKS